MTTPTNDRQTSERERLADSLVNLTLRRSLHGSDDLLFYQAAAQLRADEAEIAALRAENEALRTDAERYRYLRDNAWNSDGALVCWFDHDDGALGESVTFQGEHFDRAVDDIRSKESRRG